MHKGSCLCGSITYTVAGDIGPFGFCHCTKCQKANGTAFLAAAKVNPANFAVNDPHGYVKSFESSPGVERIFCSNCGSPLYSRRPGPPEAINLRLGTLDTDFRQEPQFHKFYADRVEWYKPGDAAPKFAQDVGSENV
jgi:hypothetical protein